MDVLNVFVNEKGDFGNPVGIVIDEKREINSVKRQQIVVDSGFSEIVFINNLKLADISIFSPTREIPFAGHAAVGASYFLFHESNIKMSNLKSMGEEIKTWQEGLTTWVQGKVAILPKWNLKEFSTSSEVENISLEESLVFGHTVVWAWIDKDRNLIRARTFANDWKIPEDEANGSGSMLLAHSLNKYITVHHGKGSVIQAKPIGNTNVAVGGLVKVRQ